MKSRASFVIALMVVYIGFTSGSALAQGQCIRVVSFEWTATLLIDPSVLVGNSDLLLANATYEPIVIFDNNFQVKPWLAESWEATDNGKEWSFKLREGIKFHDGRELTSADVVYTYRRLIDPETTSPAAAELSFLTPENIVADGRYQVKFKTREPVAELPLLLATKYALIVPEGTTREQLMKNSNGTGPFVITDFKADAPRVILKRNPVYWQSGKPLADCVEISGIQDPIARAIAIMAGEVDILVAADPTTLPQLNSDPNVDLSEAKGALLLSMVMMVDQEPFDDVRVRKAMKLVVDRETMVRVVALGYGIPGNDNPVPPNSPFAVHSDAIPQDIERAKQLLTEAGYPDGLSVELYTGAKDLAPGMLAMVQAYQEMASKAGISVNVVTVPSAGFWDDVYLKQPFVTSYWYTRHPVSSMSLGYRTGAKWNETHWYREDFDKLLDNAATRIDPKERAELYREAQRILIEEGGAIVPVFTSLVAAVRKNCTGYVPHIESRVLFQDIACER